MGMRILVCEYVTGGGLRGRVAEGPFAALRHEGEMMAGALIHDLTGLAGIQAALARDRALPPPAGTDAAALAWVAAAEAGQPWAGWSEAIAGHDAVWPIAPETGGELERLTRLIVGSGRLCLGSRADAVAVVARKSLTARCLAAAGLPVIPVFPVDASPPSAHGWVVKPDDGAGADGVLHFNDGAALDAWRGANATGGHVIQPFVPGQACSLSLLCRDGRAWILSANRQRIEHGRDGALRFRGCTVGALNDRVAEFEALAGGVAAAIPGLWGYVGVDLVIGRAGPVVVEVNPRLTTSYVGLAGLLGCNPAAMVLSLLSGDPEVPDPLPTRSVEVDVGPRETGE